MGGAAFVTGQALGRTWRPVWQIIPYGLLFGVADRFLTYALFDGALLTLAGYAINTVVICVIGLFAYRITQVKMMVTQYPWLYERAGLFSWRDRAG